MITGAGPSPAPLEVLIDEIHVDAAALCQALELSRQCAVGFEVEYRIIEKPNEVRELFGIRRNNTFGRCIKQNA